MPSLTPPLSVIHVRLRQNHMATTFDLRISCERNRLREADSVLTEAHARITRLERELSEFQPNSPVYALNHAGIFEEIPVPPSVIDLLEQCHALQERTEGAFDCTVKSGPLSRAASKRLAWSAERGVVWKLTPDAWLSFAAIGKGYALDQVRVLIERHGFTDYLLNAGGSSLVFSGFSSPGNPWSWAWSWEKGPDLQDRGIPFEHRSGERISVGVSGLHEKGRHLLDPKTGVSVEACRSALVAHPSAGAADALSTALFVSRGKFSPVFYERSGLADSTIPFATACIDSEGIPRWNGWFQKFWGSPETALLALAAMFFGLSSFWAGVARANDEAVDLGSLGQARFNPYLFERHGWLIALPLFALFLVFIHLIRIKIGRNARPVLKKGNSP